MRLASKFTPLMTMVLAVMAFAASSASAQSIEVSEEPDGEHCSPCVVHVVSTTSIGKDVHLFGIEFTDSVCDTAYDLVINEDGTGQRTNQQLTGSGCNREPCPATAWPADLREEGGSVIMETTFCIQPVGGGDHIVCTVDYVLETDVHAFEVHADDVPCHGFDESPAEISGEWAAEDGSLEIAHWD